jgi:hypothetical protein
LARRLSAIARSEAGGAVILGIVLVIIVHVFWTAIISAILQVFTVAVVVWLIGLFAHRSTSRRNH